MKRTNTKKKNPRVYWMRVEIEPDYHWPEELMVDADDMVADMTHVIRAQHVTHDTMMSLIECAIRSEVTEETENNAPANGRQQRRAGNRNATKTEV